MFQKLTDEEKHLMKITKIERLADKLGHYLTGIISTGYAKRIWQECMMDDSLMKENNAISVLVALTLYHPKGAHKLSLNKEVKKENKIRSAKLKEFFKNNNIPKDIKDLVLEYCEHHGAKKFAQSVADDDDEEEYDDKRKEMGKQNEWMRHSSKKLGQVQV